MARVLTLFLVLVVLFFTLYWVYNPSRAPQAVQPLVTDKMPVSTTPWHEYNAPMGKFRVLLPNTPHHSVDVVPDPESKENRTYEIFITASDKGTVYSINLISFPENKTAVYDDKFLEGFVNKLLLSNSKNVLKSLNKTSYRSGNALDFSVQTEDKVLHGRAFLRNKTLYVLSTASPVGELTDPGEFDLFINSFHLSETPVK